MVTWSELPLARALKREVGPFRHCPSFRAVALVSGQAAAGLETPVTGAALRSDRVAGVLDVGSRSVIAPMGSQSTGAAEPTLAETTLASASLITHRFLPFCQAFVTLLI